MSYGVDWKEIDKIHNYAINNGYDRGLLGLLIEANKLSWYNTGAMWEVMKDYVESMDKIISPEDYEEGI
jgi:hypothetical protein